MKPISLTSFCVFAGTILFAQDAALQAKSFKQDPFNHPHLSLFAAALLGTIVVVLIVVVLVYALQVIKLMRTQISQPETGREIIQKADATRVSKFRTYRWHLYGTGAGLLMVVVLIVSYQTISNSEAPPVKKLATVTATSQLEQSDANDGGLEVSSKPTPVQRGSEVFKNNCASCHRNDGGGNAVGPNLADEYWLHGGDSASVYRTIKTGVPDKGMPSWGSILTEDNVHDVTSFVLGLQGTNPPDSRAPQGEKFLRTAAVK